VIAPIKKSLWPWGKKKTITPCPLSSEEIQFKAINQLKKTGLVLADPLLKAVYKSSYQILGSVASTRGLIGNDQGFMSRIICRHVLNNYGSFVIGQLIEPAIDAAVLAHEYQLIPLKGPLRQVKAP
jgi:hypothetical protein